MWMRSNAGISRIWLVQPLDTGDAAGNAASEAAAIALVMDRPRWRLTLQAHKRLGLR